MQQGVLSIQCEIEGGGMMATARAGLLPYLELMAKLGLWREADRLIGARSGDQGWTDGQHVASGVLLNLAGGDCVDDLEQLEGDAGLGALVREAEVHGLSRRERRRLSRRHRKGRSRSFPSSSAFRRYLEGCDDASQVEARASELEAGVKAFIPAANARLRGLMALNAAVVSKVQSVAPVGEATLDMDATLLESQKREALYCYKHFSGYQPLNVWWAEQQLVLHSEFRDGNVPAGYEQLRVLGETLADMPASVGKVFLRSDSAGYQWDLLKYCAEGKNGRFGVIEFAVASDVDDAFKKAVAETPEETWRPLLRKVEGMTLETGQEWAEVCFVPNEAARKKGGPEYRFLAIREPLRQLHLPILEPEQRELPFPTMEYRDGRKYKLFGVVTNRGLAGDELIWWLRERCGKSEEAHDIMKHDLAGGTLPSGLFGANAAWWQIMILALNIHSAMKRLALGEAWMSRRLKAVRFGFIQVVGRIVRHARLLLVKLPGRCEAARKIVEARMRIRALALEPGG
jgi:hypothetical protein